MQECGGKHLDASGNGDHQVTILQKRCQLLKYATKIAGFHLHPPAHCVADTTTTCLLWQEMHSACTLSILVHLAELWSQKRRNIEPVILLSD